MKEVLMLQKHLMRFTIDWFKTQQTNATTLDLYGEHFAEEESRDSQHSSFSKIHHIANNSESDEYFLEDDEEEVFSSLMPDTATNKNKLDNSELKHLE